jgi:lipopolysaccharide transport protein LptA
MKYLALLLLVIVTPQLSHAQTQNAVEIKAKTFIFTAKNKSIWASQNVTVQDWDLNISSQTALYSNEKEEIKVAGNVIAKHGDLTLLATSLVAGLKTFTIEATEKLAFHYHHYIGSADVGKYNGNTQILKLTGNPSITHYKNTLHADEISFNMKTNKIQSKGKTKMQVSDTLTNE